MISYKIAFLLLIVSILGGYHVTLGSPLSEHWEGLDDAVTTVCETLEPMLNQDGSPSGKLEPRAGEPHNVRNDLAAPFVEGSEQLSMEYFYVLSDVHITDEESPSRLIFFDFLFDTAWRPHEDLAQHVLDAAIRTGNVVMTTYDRDFDFVIMLGDNIDNAEFIEHSILFQTLRGGLVTPDTGQLGRVYGAQTPFVHLDSESNNPFEAAGVKEGVPCYLVIGNHDVLWVGVFIGDDRLFTGDTSPFGFLPGDNPDFRFWQLPVPADPDDNRYFTGHDEVVEIMKAEERILENNLPEAIGCYAFVNENGMPIRHIVLDTEGGGPHLAEGSIRQLQFDWLRDQLETASEENQLVIVFSHHPEDAIVSNNIHFPPTRDVERFPNLRPLWKRDRDGKDLSRLLSLYPNVIMHMAGHWHINRVKAYPSPVPEKPERGFWQVLTGSMIDFPQQARIVEVVLNHNSDRDFESGAIYLTIVNHQSAPESIVERSRNSSWVDIMKDGYRLDDKGRVVGTGRGRIDDRNVILQFILSQKMKTFLNELFLSKDEDLTVTSQRFYDNCN
jgi:3',5'-cyclic AMP phosphodiesterase CpdA